MNKPPATLEDAIAIIDAHDIRTAATDVEMVELRRQLAELQSIAEQRDETFRLLGIAKSQLDEKAQQLQQATVMRDALMQGIQAFATGLPEGQQTLLRVLIDQTPGATEKIKQIEMIQLQGSIAAQQARLDELTANQ